MGARIADRKSWLLAQVTVDASGCWLWNGSRDVHGYGSPNVNGRRRRAHRLAYELFVGEIPIGMQLDHLCRVRSCVNPDHLQPVTSRENTLRGENPAAWRARQTHCHRGHPLSGANLYVWRSSRICRECRRSKKGSS